MGTQVTPEETIQPPADSPTLETPPTNQPPAPVIEAPKVDYSATLEAVLKEQNRKIAELEERNRQLTSQPAPAPEPQRSIEDTRNAFFNDPLGELEKRDKKIVEAMQATIQPLLKFTDSFRGEGTPYGKLKDRFKLDPIYAQQLLDPKVEAAVDKIMEKAELNEGNMQGALIQVAGLKAMGQLDAQLAAAGIVVRQSAPTPPAPTPVSVTPPYVPPSPPPAPRAPNGTPKTRELTELEKRLARERNMTPQQYLAWMDAPAGSIVSVNIDKDGAK